MAIAQVEPFEFFTMESLKAGWYLSWRIFVRFLLFAIPAGVIAGVVVGMGAPAVAPVLAGLVMIGWIYFWIRWTNTIASMWTEQQYGRALVDGVWWGITWRGMVVGLAMGVGVAVAQFLFSGAFALVGAIAAIGLAVAQVVITLQCTGWAMSVMAARQLGGGGGGVVVAASSAALAPRPAAAATAPTAPRVAAEPGQKMQCPKCGLYETELGTVIGWHCRICGWRESRG